MIQTDAAWPGALLILVLVVFLVIGTILARWRKPVVLPVGGVPPLDVEPNGREAFTSVPLKQGRVYRVTVTGTYEFRHWGLWYAADGFYTTDQFENFTKAYKSGEGLYLDGKPLKACPHIPVDTDHSQHRYRFEIDGTGKPVSVALRPPRCGRLNGSDLALTFELLSKDAVSPEFLRRSREEEARANAWAEEHEMEIRKQLEAQKIKAQKESEAEHARVREERRAKLEVQKRVADAEKAKAEAEKAKAAAETSKAAVEKAQAERERTLAEEREGERKRAEAEASAKEAARVQLTEKVRPLRERADELWTTTEDLRNWEDAVFRENYAQRYRAALLEEKERILTEHRKLYDLEGSVFMHYLSRSLPQSSFPLTVPIDNVLDSRGFRSRDLKLFFRLTGEFEVLLQAEWLEAASLPPSPPPPPRKKPSVEDVRERTVRRLRVQIGDHEAVMDTILIEKTRLRQKLEVQGATEEEIENNLAFLDAQMAPHLERLLERGENKNAVARRTILN